jgi:hypothetical protein
MDTEPNTSSFAREKVPYQIGQQEHNFSEFHEKCGGTQKGSSALFVVMGKKAV